MNMSLKKLQRMRVMNKQVVLVCKSGPAFDLPIWDRKMAEESQQAGFALDRVGVPREVGGRVLRLDERVGWLIAQYDLAGEPGLQSDPID